MRFLLLLFVFAFYLSAPAQEVQPVHAPAPVFRVPYGVVAPPYGSESSSAGQYGPVLPCLPPLPRPTRRARRGAYGYGNSWGGPEPEWMGLVAGLILTVFVIASAVSSH